MNIQRIRTIKFDNSVEPYIKMWQAALLMVFEDIENNPSQNYEKMEKHRTVNWIIRKGWSFYLICEFAQVCPEKTHKALMNKLRQHNLIKNE